MAFNFGGAMRGLGAGLVSSGALLEKFNERKFEEEQMKIKLDREEHMERARMQAQKEMQVAGFGHAENLQESANVHAETMTGMQIDAANKNADRSYGLDLKRLSIQEQEAQANASARASAAKYQSEEFKLKKQAYEDASDSGKMKFRESQVDALKELGVPDKAIGVYLATGNMPELEKSGIKVTGSDIKAVMDMKNQEWADLSDKEQEQAAIDLGAKNAQEARTKYQASGVADLMEFAGMGSNGKAKATDIPPSTIRPEDIPEASKRFHSLSPEQQRIAKANFVTSGLSDKEIDAITMKPVEFKREHGVDLGQFLGGLVRTGVAGVSKVATGAKAIPGAFGEAGRQVGGVLRSDRLSPSEETQIPQGYRRIQ